MSPEFRALIYSTIGAVILGILGFLGFLVKTTIQKRIDSHAPPVEQGQAISQLAETMVTVSTQAVQGIRGELEAARDDLRRARDDMERLRIESRAMIGRLSARVALLERILRENHLEVPPDITE